MSRLLTQTQVSAGGVAYRFHDDRTEVALISVGEQSRWQLPKGTVNPGETIEMAAQREVREEAGIDTDLLELLDRIEYWFTGKNQGQAVRTHKFVYFYLMQYRGGDPKDHDHEVNEARWVEINRAIEMLAFPNEKEIALRAKAAITSG